MIRHVIILVIALAAGAPAQAQLAVSYTGDAFPEEQGWTRMEFVNLAERWLESGWLVQAPVLRPCPPDCTTRDSYRYELLSQSGAVRWTMRWVMETDGPLAPGAVAPASIVAGGQSGVRYHFTIGNDELVFNRGSQFPLVFHSFEPGIHEFRLELSNDTEPVSYAFYFDGVVVDAGEAEASYPTDDSFVTFQARAAIEDSITRWDLIEFGDPTVAVPAVSNWGAVVLALLVVTAATLAFGRGPLLAAKGTARARRRVRPRES